MSYRYLDRAQSLMSTKSTSDFGVGRATSAIKDNHEDGAGVLARIKRDCDKSTAYAANIYCMDCNQSRIILKLILDKQIIDWFVRDKKRKSVYALRLSDIAISRVFDNECNTIAQCADVLNLASSSYFETWHTYVQQAESLLLTMLCDADATAAGYYYDVNKLELDETE